MSYWLARHVGTGAVRTDPFRPLGSDEVETWSSIDLRGDCTVPDGFALMHTPDQLRARPGLILLGDDLDDPSLAMRQGIESVLGLSLTLGSPRRSGLRYAIAELLTDHATPDGDKRRWNPLLPELRVWRIYLGGLIYEAPRISGGATITESFNKADSTNLGPDLSWTEVQGDLTIVSNKVRAVSNNTASTARAGNDLPSADAYAQMECYFSGASDNYIIPAIRFASGAVTFYEAAARGFGGNSNIQLGKVVATTETLLGSPTTESWASGDLAKVQAVGSTLTAYHSGALRITLTDTSIIGNLRSGFYIYAGNATQCDADNFQAGEVVVARPTNLNVIVAPVAAVERAASW